MKSKCIGLFILIAMISVTSVCYAADLCCDYVEMRKYDDAIKECTKQINGEIKVDADEISYTNRGIAYAGKGQYDHAIADYDKAIELNPRYERAYVNRGDSYYARRQYDHAIADYKDAIDLNPMNSYTDYNMACLYSVKNNPEEACKWLRDSFENGFDNWERIKKDKDFDNIRNSSCYKKIMEGK